MTPETTQEKGQTASLALGTGSAIEALQADNRFLAEMMLIKFGPTNYCLTSDERSRLKECYSRAFSSPNSRIDGTKK
jgi:hypothetical protein